MVIAPNEGRFKEKISFPLKNPFTTFESSAL